MNFRKIAGLGLLAVCALSNDQTLTVTACSGKACESLLPPLAPVPMRDPKTLGFSPQKKREEKGEQGERHRQKRCHKRRNWKDERIALESTEEVDQEGNKHLKHKWTDKKGSKHETDHWVDKDKNVNQKHRWIDADSNVYQSRRIADKDGKITFNRFKTDKNGVVTKIEGHGHGHHGKDGQKGEHRHHGHRGHRGHHGHHRHHRHHRNNGKQEEKGQKGEYKHFGHCKKAGKDGQVGEHKNHEHREHREKEFENGKFCERKEVKNKQNVVQAVPLLQIHV